MPVSESADAAPARDVLVVAGVAAAALYVVVSSRTVERHHVTVLATVQQLWALAAIGVAVVTVSATDAVTWPDDAGTIGLAAGSGIINYALPFWLYLAALRHLPVTVAATYLCLIPVFGVAGSAILLDEPVTAIQLGSSTTVVAALVLLARSQQRDRSG